MRDSSPRDIWDDAFWLLVVLLLYVGPLAAYLVF